MQGRACCAGNGFTAFLILILLRALSAKRSPLKKPRHMSREATHAIVLPTKRVY